MNTSPVSRQPPVTVDPVTIASYEPAFTPVSGAPLNKSDPQWTAAAYAQSIPSAGVTNAASLHERARALADTLAPRPGVLGCAHAVKEGVQKLTADFSAIRPKVLALQEHLKQAAPAMKALGKDAVDLCSGLAHFAEAVHRAHIAVEAAEVPIAGPVIVAYEGVMTGIDVVEGWAEVRRGLANAPGDWEKASPHVKQILDDLRALAPHMKQVVDDVLEHAGVVRQHCGRM